MGSDLVSQGLAVGYPYLLFQRVFWEDVPISHSTCVADNSRQPAADKQNHVNKVRP